MYADWGNDGDGAIYHVKMRFVVESSPPAIYRGARHIKTTDGGRNTEVKIIGYNRLTETYDL